jgi:SAM-dependent methyltransferase
MNWGRCPACDGTRWVPHRTVRGATIELCGACGLGRTLPPPLRDSQDFGTVSMAVGRERSRFRWRRIAQKQLELLRPLQRSIGSRPCLVDVGCSVGALVEEANCRGWVAVGFEPDWRACLIASVQAPVVHGFFSAKTVLANTVHAVVMSHVLEHVDDPVGLLREIGDALVPGGGLLVVCPN